MKCEKCFAEMITVNPVQMVNGDVYYYCGKCYEEIEEGREND